MTLVFVRTKFTSKTDKIDGNCGQYCDFENNNTYLKTQVESS